MIPGYSLKLIFRQSRSKNYSQALKLADNFNFFQSGDPNIVNVSMREIFEKWEFFNLLFWRTVDWKGTILEWEGMEFHSHSDKTRIFYALQHAQVSYICFLEQKIREVYKVPAGLIKYEDLDLSVYTEDDLNRLIEIMQVYKAREEVLSTDEYDNINVRERSWFLQNRIKI